VAPGDVGKGRSHMAVAIPRPLRTPNGQITSSIPREDVKRFAETSSQPSGMCPDGIFFLCEAGVTCVRACVDAVLCTCIRACMYTMFVCVCVFN